MDARRIRNQLLLLFPEVPVCIVDELALVIPGSPMWLLSAGTATLVVRFCFSFLNCQFGNCAPFRSIHSLTILSRRFKIFWRGSLFLTSILVKMRFENCFYDFVRWDVGELNRPEERWFPDPMALTLVQAKTWPSDQMKTLPYRRSTRHCWFPRCQEVPATWEAVLFQVKFSSRWCLQVRPCRSLLHRNVGEELDCLMLRELLSIARSFNWSTWHKSLMYGWRCFACCHGRNTSAIQNARRFYKFEQSENYRHSFHHSLKVCARSSSFQLSSGQSPGLSRCVLLTCTHLKHSWTACSENRKELHLAGHE